MPQKQTQKFLEPKSREIGGGEMRFFVAAAFLEAISKYPSFLTSTDYLYE